MAVNFRLAVSRAGLALSRENRYDEADAGAWLIYAACAARRRRPQIAPGPPWRSVVMVKNVGTADRVARLSVAALLAFLALTTSVEGWGEIVCYVVATYLALTAIFGSCLIYRVLDVDSCHDHGGTYHSGEDVFDGRGGN
jgi:hypothetical protein